MENIKSFLSHYRAYFGDATFRYLDLLPLYDSFNKRTHLDLDEKFKTIQAKDAVEALDKYTHPCWCNPELIYADESRGNEVWLHKPAQ